VVMFTSRGDFPQHFYSVLRTFSFYLFSSTSVLFCARTNIRLLSNSTSIHSDGMDDPFITMGNSGSSEFNMPSGYDACPSRPESPIARPSIPQRQSSHTYKPIKRIACLGSGFVGGQSSLHLLPETLYCPLPRGRIRLMEVPLAFMLARFLSAYVLIVSNRAYVSGHCVQDRSRSYCR
jgi:hypothetical protein